MAFAVSLLFIAVVILVKVSVAVILNDVALFAFEDNNGILLSPAAASHVY